MYVRDILSSCQRIHARIGESLMQGENNECTDRTFLFPRRISLELCGTSQSPCWLRSGQGHTCSSFFFSRAGPVTPVNFPRRRRQAAAGRACQGRGSGERAAGEPLHVMQGCIPNAEKGCTWYIAVFAFLAGLSKAQATKLQHITFIYCVTIVSYHWGHYSLGYLGS